VERSRFLGCARLADRESAGGRRHIAVRWRRPWARLGSQNHQEEKGRQGLVDPRESYDEPRSFSDVLRDGLGEKFTEKRERRSR
jgi:hypothetical protein